MWMCRDTEWLKKKRINDNGLLLITFRDISRLTVDYRDFNIYILFLTLYKWEHFAFKIGAYKKERNFKNFPIYFCCGIWLINLLCSFQRRRRQVSDPLTFQAISDISSYIYLLLECVVFFYIQAFFMQVFPYWLLLVWTISRTGWTWDWLWTSHEARSRNNGISGRGGQVQWDPTQIV